MTEERFLFLCVTLCVMQIVNGSVALLREQVTLGHERGRIMLAAHPQAKGLMNQLLMNQLGRRITKEDGQEPSLRAQAQRWTSLPARQFNAWKYACPYDQDYVTRCLARQTAFFEVCAAGRFSMQRRQFEGCEYVPLPEELLEDFVRSYATALHGAINHEERERHVLAVLHNNVDDFLSVQTVTDIVVGYCKQ